MKHTKKTKTIYDKISKFTKSEQYKQNTKNIQTSFNSP